MKKDYTISVLIFFLCIGIARAQSVFSENYVMNTSLDLITDPVNIAMGESFVANNTNIKSLFENPAAIYSQRNVSVFYDYRFLGWMNDVKDSKCISAGVATNTKVGNFGVSFNQLTIGPYRWNGFDSRLKDQNKTIVLSYGNKIFDGLTAGINVKFFDRKLLLIGIGQNEINSKTEFLVDVGILYNFAPLLNTGEIKSHLSFGMSLQNFGTDNSKDFFQMAAYQKLPRYLRAGFAYETNLMLGRNTKTNIDVLLTGEYKGYINPIERQAANTDYWSAGIEATLFNIVSLRAGTLKSPEYSILFDRNRFNFRYGAGINIPVAVLGLRNPAVIKFDYAVIPVNQVEFINAGADGRTFTEKTRSHLYSFGVTLNYNM